VREVLFPAPPFLFPSLFSFPSAEHFGQEHGRQKKGRKGRHPALSLERSPPPFHSPFLFFFFPSVLSNARTKMTLVEEIVRMVSDAAWKAGLISLPSFFFYLSGNDLKTRGSIRTEAGRPLTLLSPSFSGYGCCSVIGER